MKPDSAVEHALFRVRLATDRITNDAIEHGAPTPGSDVSLFRALRELHRSLNASVSADMYDPNRLLRCFLWDGVSDFAEDDAYVERGHNCGDWPAPCNCD